MKLLLLSLLSTISLITKANFNHSILEENPISITFILGEDKNPKDRFFSLAKKYYSSDEGCSKNILVENCKSLLSVRNYLENHPARNKGAWQEINLVLHSNQWTGLSIPVVENGERTNIDNLFHYMAEGIFQPLPNEIINSQTNIHLHACGLGSNKKLLDALQLAFGGFDEEKPKLISSENFVYFGEDTLGQVKTKYLKPYYAFYKTAFRPADLILKKQFEERYPSENINWVEAINCKIPESAEQAFHTRFNVPVTWTVIEQNISKKIPFLREQDKLKYVRSLEGLMQLLEKHEIPEDKFRWSLKQEIKDGKRIISLKGKSTVLCVLHSA